MKVLNNDPGSAPYANSALRTRLLRLSVLYFTASLLFASVSWMAHSHKGHLPVQGATFVVCLAVIYAGTVVTLVLSSIYLIRWSSTVG